MPQYIETMKQLMDASARKDKTAFLSFFATDIEYILHPNARPLKGLEWLEKFLNKYHETLDGTVWRIDRYAQNGNKLLVEGYEEYIEKASGKRVGHPYMGIVEFNDEGKITHMRDYFEMDGKPAEK